MEMMEWMCVNGRFQTVGSLLRRVVKPVRLPHYRLRHRPRNGQRRVEYFYFFCLLFICAFAYFLIVCELGDRACCKARDAVARSDI